MTIYGVRLCLFLKQKEASTWDYDFTESGVLFLRDVQQISLIELIGDAPRKVTLCSAKGVGIFLTSKARQSIKHIRKLCTY